MNFLKNLSIRNKLLLISTVPMLALFYFVFTAVESELERKDIMLQVYDEFGEIEQMSKLLHECQIERGLVLAYLASQSRIDHDAMVNQRKFTNNASAEVQKIFARHKKDSPILSFLDSLSSYREASQNYANNLNRYKLLLLSEMGKTLRTSRNPVIKNHLESHVYLLHSKEYFAQLRSILASSIPLKKFKKGDYGTFALLKGAADRNYERFLNTASPDVVAVANIKFRGEGIARATQSIDSVFYDPDYLTRLNKEDWWAHSTNTIDVVKQIEDFSLGRVKEIAQAELASINRTVYISVGIAVGVIILIIILISVTIRQIVSTLSTIKDAAEKITNGEVDIEINVSSTDEIGALAGAFNKMIASTKKYAQAADIVGRGDYSVDLPVRSKSDVLGIALNNMRNNLKKLAQENEVRTWLLTGNNVLNDCMRGDKELTELSNEVITALTEYLKGQIGALYVRNNGHLVLSGSYAFDSANKRQLINIGEGLAGQAALTGKPILFNDVPGDYIKINSALGEAPPRNVLLYPIEYEGEVTGILEVGAAKDFSSVDMELLKVVGNNIGIAVHAAQARERLKLLLEETQRQAEELESQQEELRQFNEELQDKTQLLERSEEELKAQQEELQQTNEELAEKAGLLEEQKEALESAKMEIEEKVSELEIVSKYKSEFLANMSHELRTPLNSILILTQVLMENKTKSLNQKEVQYVNTIYHSGNDLLNLINQILDLSKIEAGKMEVDVEEFLIEDVVKNIQSAFAETAISKSIAFDIQASESMMASSIESDRQMLEQILKNFLANAFKFTERGGGVTLNIHHADKSVSFASRTLQSADKVIAFSVTDNGIGIPKEKFDVIFGAFQQVDGSTKRKYGGTGLGLSISRELSNLLGGEIQLQSQEGEGSTFTFFIAAKTTYEKTVPAIKHAPAKVKVPKELAVRINPGGAMAEKDDVGDDRNVAVASDRIILIIEDDVQFSRVLLEFVRDRHYKGILAFDGSTGLSYARQYKPDAILLDMKLPVLAGEEVLRQLKLDSQLRHIPVQIISGYGVKMDGLRQGAFDFIKKPVTRDDFWHALDRIETFMSRKPKKLLIVEDDVQHNAVVRELIGNGDVVCDSAYSGSEGYSLLSRDTYDCVIVDIGLPDMTGFDFLEKIRQNEELHRVPIVVYTGKSLSKEDSTRLERLANTVVLKTAHSHERLLDETALFLHRVEAKLPKERQKTIRKLHKTDEVLKNKTVLIADDDVRNLFSLITVLEQEGMNCIIVENGKLAVDAFDQNPSIEIVLMDVMMPEMDGYEATREIRKNPRYQNLPIIALTAKAMKGDREKCIAAGMSDYISKPVNVQQLLSLMRVWLYD